MSRRFALKKCTQKLDGADVCEFSLFCNDWTQNPVKKSFTENRCYVYVNEEVQFVENHNVENKLNM
jgi:hypothetical protein